MSNQDNNKPREHKQAEPGASDSTGAAPNDLQDLVEVIAHRLRSEERRHAGVLQHMQDRLAMLGAEATVARYRVPESYKGALDNIQSGLHQLSSRIAEAGEDNSVPTEPHSQRAATDVTPVSEAPAALLSAVPPYEDTQFASAGSEGGNSVDPFDVVDQSDPEDIDPNNPWDADSADALTRVYESDDVGYVGPMPDPDAPSSSTKAAEKETSFAADDNASPTSFDDEFETGFETPVSEFTAQNEFVDAAPPAAPQHAEREWLEDRFAEIARRIEGQSDPSAVDEALQSLTERFDVLEDRFSTAMEDVATRSDLGGLSIVEAHINEINEHLEVTQAKFVKLDSIETQLASVMERLTDEHFGDPANAGKQLSPEIIEEVALAAAEKAASKLADGDQTVGSVQTEERMTELQYALNNFMEERRQGEMESQTVLETMQQAMIRMLDRVDAIETGVNPPLDAQTLAQQSMPQTSFATEPEVGVGGEETPSPSGSFEARMHEIISSKLPDVEPDPEEAPYAPEVAPQPGSDTPQDHEVQVGFAQDPTMETPSDLALSDTPFDMVPGAEPHADEPQAFEVPPAPEMPAPSIPNVEVPPADVDLTAPETQDIGDNYQEVPPPPAPAPPPVSTTDSISKMRQDLIANAQKAKLQAAVDAGRQMDVAKKKKGLGLSLGFRKKSQGDNAAVATEDGGDKEPESKSGGLFGLAKRKLIVSMLIAMCSVPAIFAIMEAPAGPALLARLTDTFAISSSSMTADNAVAPATVSADDVFDPAEVRPGVAPGTPPDDNVERRVTEAGDGYEGQIIDDVGEAELTAARLVSGAPAGTTMYDSGRRLTPELIGRLREHEDQAERSAELGKYAVPTTPAALSGEDEGNAFAQNEKLPEPILKGGARRTLGLPPANVGPLSLRIAAAKGHPSAQFQVGTRLAEGKGNAQDFSKAAEWFKRSAQQGFAQSQYRLGTFYERGLGVNKDMSRAQAWYRRAAEQGNVKAMHNLAVLSANPKSKAPDYTAAAHWFSSAADRGLSDSQYNLAVLFENGLGVPRDLKRAYKYFVLAARTGDAEAASRRDAVIAQLDTADLAAAERLVKNHKRKQTDRLANDARAAGQAWQKNSSGANYIN